MKRMKRELAIAAMLGILAAGCSNSKPVSTPFQPPPSMPASPGATSSPGAMPTQSPPVGFTGPLQFSKEQVFSPYAKHYDDWEPTLAADGSGHVYLMTTRIKGNPTCAKCPKPSMTLKRSTDGGQTWLPDQYMCQCPKANGEWDPQVTVPSAAPGTVYAAWMQEYTPGISFSASHDYGATWEPKISIVKPAVENSDKEWITTSADGQDIYVFFNGNRYPIFNDHSPEGTPFVVESHDGGATWDKPVELPNQGKFPNGKQQRYYFASGATVLADGTIIAAETGYRMNYKVGSVLIVTFRSTDGGKTWTRTHLAAGGRGPKCPDGSGCAYGYLGSQEALAADAIGKVYAFYNASSKPLGPARVYMRTSSDEGATWSDPQQLSKAKSGVNADWPMVAADGTGIVGVGWFDDRTGSWNTWFRLSTDGGKTFGPEVKLSNSSRGTPYKSASGFGLPYGDYGNLAIANGQVWAIWGEGPDYIGPGTTWFTHAQLPSG